MPIDINPVVPQGHQLVQSYGDGRFKISAVVFDGSVLVFPEQTIPWSAKSPEDITIESLSVVTDQADDFDILLIGSGPTFGRIPADLRRALKDVGLMHIKAPSIPALHYSLYPFHCSG